jgi:hypothetical protein
VWELAWSHIAHANSHRDFFSWVAALDLPTLVYRRIRGDLINVYKYMHGHYNVEAKYLFKPANEYSSTLRSSVLKIAKPDVRLDIKKYSFTNRVINWWNNLPVGIKEASSINCFKNRLDKHFSKNEKIYNYRYFNIPQPLSLEQ